MSITESICSDMDMDMDMPTAYCLHSVLVVSLLAFLLLGKPRSFRLSKQLVRKAVSLPALPVLPSLPVSLALFISISSLLCLSIS